MWNPENFGWAQYLIIALLASQFFYQCAKHGEQRKLYQYSILSGIIRLAIWVPILYFGGFFS